MNLPYYIKMYILSFIFKKCYLCPKHVNHSKIYLCMLSGEQYCKKHINELCYDFCLHESIEDFLYKFHNMKIK